MTEAPTKPLSEQFAEAMQRGGILNLAVENGETIVAALCEKEAREAADQEQAAIDATPFEVAESRPSAGAFKLGDLVQKKSGASWHGNIVGFYSTALTPRGYCVESAYESWQRANLS